MTYTITPSSVTREMLLQFTPLMLEADRVRAFTLARALDGRYVPHFEGFSMRPYAVERWKILFDAGFSARKYGGGNSVYGWHLWRDDSPRPIPLALAMRQARAERNELNVAKALTIEEEA